MVLTLFNTLARREQPFEPMTPGVVRMFVCGPTVYDLSHVGHAKTYTQAEADAIRDELHGRGIAIEDSAGGTRWWVRKQLFAYRRSS